jgi:hypothetical protein
VPSIFGLWGDSLDHLVHLLMAFVLALPIGWHRAREEQSAGLRTFPLVCDGQLRSGADCDIGEWSQRSQ